MFIVESYLKHLMQYLFIFVSSLAIDNYLFKNNNNIDFEYHIKDFVGVK